MRKNLALRTWAVSVVLLLSCAKDQGPFVPDNPLDSGGSNWQPPVVAAMADVSVNIKDSITITATAVDNEAVVKYAWARSGSAYFDTTTTGSLKVAFPDSGRKVVRVKVVDNDGVWSRPDSCVVRVTLDPPVVTAMRDTSVNLKDSIAIVATVVDNGTVVKYAWARNGLTYTDTTSNGSLKVAFPDTGRRVVRVRVVDDDGVWSLADSCVVRVTLDPPVLTAMRDTNVNIRDTITITATAVDNGFIVKYAWARGGVTYADTTTTGSLKVAYPDSGRKVVRVKALDDDVVWSVPDSCVVRATLDPPMVTAHRDTTVAFNATTSVSISVMATDVNATGSITKYYWDVGANGWEDSSDVASYTVTSSVGGQVVLRWAARDDDGLMALDTFLILFNRPPGNPSIMAPERFPGWIRYNRVTGKGTLPFELSATDPDLPNDTLTYMLYAGQASSALSLVYSGRSTQCNVANIDANAMLYWRLQVSDLFGDSAIVSGSLVSPSEPPIPAGMRLINGGTFQMGSTASLEEQPIHSVTVSSFWMDTTEVTQVDYRTLMGVNPSFFTGDDRRPVDKVTWFDAVLYCNKRSKRDGWDTVYCYTSITGAAGNGCSSLGELAMDTTKRGYRLPTEAEWEYACRAGTNTNYYWGTEPITWYAQWSSTHDLITQAVARLRPNAWGLYDMSGNVFELCNDWYGSYGSGVQVDPTGVSNGSERILRGGGTFDDAMYLRSATRFRLSPSLTIGGQGFRVALPSR